MSYRCGYDLTYDQILQQERQSNRGWIAEFKAKRRFRMYANLFCRDCRKVMLTDSSKCASCGSKQFLQIDHIVPISKGGKNEFSNVQLLCKTCNRHKSDKL